MGIEFNDRTLMPGGKFTALVTVSGLGWDGDGTRIDKYECAWRALTRGESEQEFKDRIKEAKEGGWLTGHVRRVAKVSVTIKKTKTWERPERTKAWERSFDREEVEAIHRGKRDCLLAETVADQLRMEIGNGTVQNVEIADSQPSFFKDPS